MPDVVFKDLCIDVTAGAGRPAAVAAFWGAALNMKVTGAGGEDSRLVPGAGQPVERTIWINTVPEPIAGKTRVHLDLCAPDGSADSFVAAGATLLRSADQQRPWHVLEDPDGVAFCVFPPDLDVVRTPGPWELVVDADDPERIAAWWAERFGATVHRRPDRRFVWLEGVPGWPYARWEFNPVPEPKTVKNRVHWDVGLDDASIDDLVAAGATLLAEPTAHDNWWVLADPEGNEFCAFP